MKIIVTLLVGALLGAVALQWHHDQDAPAVPAVQVVYVPAVAPPGRPAEPEALPLDGPAPAPVPLPPPAPPAPPATAPTAEPAKLIRSPAVYAMAARRQCASIDGDPDAFVLRIVEDETTISTAQMDRIRALAEQCSQITSKTPMVELARLGREFADR
jgi:hypothetical protein